VRPSNASRHARGLVPHARPRSASEFTWRGLARASRRGGGPARAGGAGGRRASLAQASCGASISDAPNAASTAGAAAPGGASGASAAARPGGGGCPPSELTTASTKTPPSGTPAARAAAATRASAATRTSAAPARAMTSRPARDIPSSEHAHSASNCTVSSSAPPPPRDASAASSAPTSSCCPPGPRTAPSHPTICKRRRGAAGAGRARLAQRLRCWLPAVVEQRPQQAERRAYLRVSRCVQWEAAAARMINLQEAGHTSSHAPRSTMRCSAAGSPPTRTSSSACLLPPPRTSTRSTRLAKTRACSSGALRFTRAALGGRWGALRGRPGGRAPARFRRLLRRLPARARLQPPSAGWEGVWHACQAVQR